MLICADSLVRVRREENSISNENTGKLRFFALKNSTASAQLILKPKEDCTFSVVLSPLTDGKGNLIPAECLRAFYEKYIFVDRNWQKNGFPVGDYPDALIPADAPVLHGENFVKAGENGAIYIELNAATTLRAGTYRGVFEVTADEIYRIEVEAEISETTLPSRKPRSLFAVNGEQVAHYEKDASQETYDRYCEMLIAHGLSPTGCFLRETSLPSDRFAYSDWIDKCAEMIEKGANTYSIPSTAVKSAYGDSFSPEELFKRLLAIKQKSVETGKNYFEYAVFYDWLIDEPFLCEYPNGKVEFHVNNFCLVIDKVAEGFPIERTAFEQELVDSLLKIPHIVTDFLQRTSPETMRAVCKADGSPYVYDLSKVTLCPKFDGYRTQEMADGYAQQRERWGYGCNTPNAPFPGYHIDDAGQSAQLVGWLMAKYGISGNLYWVVNYGMEINTTGKPLWLDDAFSTAHRGFGANGDGVLLYPGESYGIKEPISCLRLKAIRDGNQDYAVLTETKREYETRGIPTDGLWSRLFAPIADGVKLDAYGRYFDLSRRTAIALYELVKEIGFTLEVKEEEDGFRFTFLADCDYIVSVNGQRRDKQALILEKNSGFAEITVEYKNKRKNLALWLGTGLKVILHETLFARKAITGNASVTINQDEIRRRVAVTPKNDPIRLKIDAGEVLSKYISCAFLIRVKECGVGYEVKSNGKTVACGELSPDWNRVELPTELLSGGEIELALKKRVKIWLGEIYLFA